MLYCIIPSVGNVQVQAAGKISLSAKLTYCWTRAAWMSLEHPLNWELPTGVEEGMKVVVPSMLPLVQWSLTVVHDGIALVYGRSISTLKRWHLFSNTTTHFANHTNCPLRVPTYFPQWKLLQELWRLVGLPQHKLWGVTDHFNGSATVLSCYEALCCPEAVWIGVQSLQTGTHKNTRSCICSPL